MASKKVLKTHTQSAAVIKCKAYLKLVSVPIFARRANE
jgi:hypothetical protein